MLVTPLDLDLDVLDKSAYTKLAVASENVTAVRRYDTEYQTELHWWAGHSGDPEGIPREAPISDAEFARVGVGRTFPSAPHSARRDSLEDQARLLVLSSPRESVTTWLHTGEALSAALLEFTAAGLTTCALTHITEIPAGREAIAGMLPHPGIPQVVIRVGTAPADAAPPADRHSDDEPRLSRLRQRRWGGRGNFMSP
ncbi:hypothetical protein ACQP2U_18930 [Nocardia sp. CA-084685]|uniref:hypothetical protein n=1 Tax=Nocardia sp. CA-084685 TaxID=3239970 RepID=UPI003D99A9C9